MDQFVTTVALIGIVIIVASLLSGALEKLGVPLVAVFLLLGASLGPWGLGVIDITLTSPSLRVLATLGLALVLFSDAVTINPKDLLARLQIAWRLLGPGTIVPAVIIACAAWYLLQISAAAAALLGAALASTDPVLLRSVLRSRALPVAPRVALRMETGMNDVVLLPIAVISILILGEQAGNGHHGLTATDVTRRLIGLFLLGPAVGAAIGWVGITILGRVRERLGVRRDYESLYALGIAFSGFAAAEAVGGSGFLAAFAAGLMVAVRDIELCDCFLEYGESTAEMLLLLTFVALGTSLIWTGLTVITVRTLLFAAVALFARAVVLLPMLRGTGIITRDRRLIAAFGPRGLSSLLFTLLAVFEGVPNAEQLFSVASLVVLLSVVIHGGGIGFFLRANRVDLTSTSVPVTALSAAPSSAVVDAIPERISIDEVRTMLAAHTPLLMLDVRKDENYRTDPRQAADSVRVLPIDAVRTLVEQRRARDLPIIAYCACDDEATSLEVVRELRDAGWTNARALTGGWKAWLNGGLPLA